MNTTLQDLPPELLCHILSFLTQTHDITIYRSLCRAFRDIIPCGHKISTHTVDSNLKVKKGLLTDDTYYYSPSEFIRYRYSCQKIKISQISYLDDDHSHGEAHAFEDQLGTNRILFKCKDLLELEDVNNIRKYCSSEYGDLLCLAMNTPTENCPISVIITTIDATTNNTIFEKIISISGVNYLEVKALKGVAGVEPCVIRYETYSQSHVILISQDGRILDLNIDYSFYDICVGKENFIILGTYDIYIYSFEKTIEQGCLHEISDIPTSVMHINNGYFLERNTRQIFHIDSPFMVYSVSPRIKQAIVDSKGHSIHIRNCFLHKENVFIINCWSLQLIVYVYSMVTKTLKNIYTCESNGESYIVNVVDDGDLYLFVNGIILKVVV